MSQMEGAASKDFAEVTEMVQRDSSAQVISHPKVVFLDPLDSVQEAPEPEQPNTTRKRPRISPPSSSSTIGFAPGDQPLTTVLQLQRNQQDGDDTPVTILPPFTGLIESEFERASDSDSEHNAGSTIADALKTAPNCTLPDSSDQSSVATPVNRPIEPRDASLGGRRRIMIKEHFEKSERFRLHPCRPIVAFTESQISAVMRVVANETARASYDMLENLVYRASRLSLAARPRGTHSDKKGSSRRGSCLVTSTGIDQRSSSGGYSDTSGALRTDEDLESIRYSFEHPESGAQPDLPRTSSIPSCSRADSGSPLTSFNADSPGLQTLAALIQEAIEDRQQRGKSLNARNTTQVTRSTNERRKVSRTCKVMK